ncbi:MAG: LptF/LptG family permease [Deinococcales bacterium]
MNPARETQKNLQPRPPSITKLDWYLVGEILPWLFGSLVLIALLMIMGALFERAGEFLTKGASPILMLQYLVFRLPEFLSLGLPLAMLFATMMGLSRLSQDSELKAAIVSGVSPTRLVMPVVCLGTVVALVAFINAETLKPRAFLEAQRVFKDIVLSNPKIVVSDGQFFKDSQNQVIYIAPGGLSEGGILRAVTVLQGQAGQVPSSITRAPSGKILREQGAILLENGIRTTFKGGDARPVTIARFEQAVIPIRQLRQGSSLSADAMQLSVFDLLARITAYRAQGFIPNNELTALHRKFAEPLAAVAFALFGIGISLWTLRSNQGLGLTGAAFSIFFYYATSTVFRVMGENGALPPLLAAWIPILLYAGVGATFLLLARRR